MEKTSKSQISKSALTAAVSSVAILAAAPVAVAQTLDQETAMETPVNIPAGALSRSILTISDAFGVDILAPSELVSDKTSPAVSGTTSPVQALNAALAGSGLTYTSTDGAFVIVRQSVQEDVVAAPVSSQAGETSDPLTADTIIVQGRFQQSLIDRIPIAPQELPFSLNTLDRDFIDRRNFIVPLDAVSLIPNIDLANDTGGFGAQRLIVRGYSAPYIVNNKFQNDPPRGGGGRDDSFIDRVEVLKGPASIALGPILPGGIVNLITKSPEEEAFFGYELSTDQFGTIDTEFDYNAGRLLGSDSIGFRVSGAYRDIGFDADQTERKNFAIRPVVDVDFSDRTFGQFSVSYNKQDTTPNLGFALFSDGSIPDEFDTSTFFGFDDGFVDSEDVLIEGQIAHEFLDNLRLTVRGSRQESDIRSNNTSGAYNYTYDDGGPGIGLDNPIVYFYGGYRERSETINEFVDAQLSYDFELFGQRQDFVVGASYYKTEGLFEVDFDGGTIGPIPLSDINNPLMLEDEGELQLVTDDSETVASIFAELAFRPTDRLTVIAGMRYDEVDDEVLSGFGDGSPTISTEDATTFRIGASYKLTQGINAYGSIAESFVPQRGTKFDGSPIEASTGISYELGLKANFLDERVNLEAAVFDTRRENVSVLDLENSDLPFIRFETTIGEQRNRGFELFGSVRPIDGLRLDLSYGFLEVDILEADDLFNFETAFPEQTANALLSYQIQSGAFQGLEFGGGPRHVGTRESARVDDFQFDDYTITDAFVSYPINDNMNVALNVINLTDELYLKSAGFGEGLLTGASAFGEPRTFRLTLRGQF